MVSTKKRIESLKKVIELAKFEVLLQKRAKRGVKISDKKVIAFRKATNKILKELRDSGFVGKNFR